MASWVPVARQSSSPLVTVVSRVLRLTTLATAKRSCPPSPLAAPCTSAKFNCISTIPLTIVYRSLTSVGSTQGINEAAASFSSGGFSNIFARPSYQDDAVAAYLDKLGNTNAGLFNPQGRAFPDVSAQGVNFVVDVGGQGQGVSGTSASSPTFASVVALLNDELLNAGKSPLGFLNPLLYSTGAAALNDVTKGSNPGCGTDGFPALAGWDPVTGLGTPDFAKLLTLVTGSAASSGSAASNSSASNNAVAVGRKHHHGKKN